MSKDENFNEWRDLFGYEDLNFDRKVDYEDSILEDELENIHPDPPPTPPISHHKSNKTKPTNSSTSITSCYGVIGFILVFFFLGAGICFGIAAIIFSSIGVEPQSDNVTLGIFSAVFIVLGAFFYFSYGRDIKIMFRIEREQRKNRKANRKNKKQ